MGCLDDMVFHRYFDIGSFGGCSGVCWYFDSGHSGKNASKIGQNPEKSPKNRKNRDFAILTYLNGKRLGGGKSVFWGFSYVIQCSRPKNVHFCTLFLT